MTAPKGARIMIVDELQQIKFCSLSEPDFMKRSTARREESGPKAWKHVQVHIKGFLW